MKLVKYVLAILILMIICSSMTPFGIQCNKCWEHDHIRSVANRSIADEQSGDKRAVYRCQYGHITYVDWETGERE